MIEYEGHFQITESSPPPFLPNENERFIRQLEIRVC